METNSSNLQDPVIFYNAWKERRKQVRSLLKAGRARGAWDLVSGFIRDKSYKDANSRFVHQESNLFGAVAKAEMGDLGVAANLLRAAIDSGFSDYHELCSEPIYRSLQKLSNYDEILSATKKYGDYHAVLDAFSTYDAPHISGDFNWTYEPFSSKKIEAIANEFSLDEIAGDGSDWSKARRLVLWLHTQVRHDGMEVPPLNRDGAELLRISLKESEGRNCRMLATILNDCALSVGLYSRMMTCRSSNPDDTDCHVVNAIWSRQLQKWMYLDPSFDAYFLNEAGEPLSPMEVRETLVFRKAPRLNPSLNWNGEWYDPNKYLLYMTKNLFMMTCPVASVPGYESRPLTERSYATLLPSGAAGAPAPGGMTEVVVRSPELFWQKPDT